LEESSKFPPPQYSSLRVSTDRNSLIRVLEWFDCLESDIVPQLVWLQFKTALAEGFMNAVLHAHGDRKDAPEIEIEFEQTPTYLKLRIIDCGSPFDLDDKLTTLHEADDLHATSGRGLKLMQCIADRLTYERLDSDRNCLSILKYYEREPLV